MATLTASLELDTSSALADVEQIASAVEAATTDVTVTFDPDVSGFDDLFDDLEPVQVPVEVDAGSFGDDLASFFDELEALTVEVDPELAGFDDLFDELSSLEVAPVVVEVDVEGAQEAAEEVDEVGNSAEASKQSMDGFSQATAGFAATAGLASGSAEGLVGALGALGPAGGVAAAAIGAATLGVGSLFSAAVESTGSTERFEHVLGSFAGAVDSVELDGLNLSLEEFAVLVGQDDEALRNSLTTLVAYGQASGVAADTTAAYAEQVTLLAGRAVALKPSLEIGATVDGLSRTLATGGARLGRYGLDIGTVADRQAAANEIFGQAYEDLGRYEKGIVGATVATDNLGTSLQRDIIAGSENVEVKLNSLQQTFQNTVETLGEPLILPIFDLLAAGIPIAEALASVFASIGTAVVPLITGYLAGVAPVFDAIADAAAEIAPEIAQFAPEFAELAAAFGEFGVVGVEAALSLAEIGLALAELGTLENIVLIIQAAALALEGLTAPLRIVADVMEQTIPKAVGEAASGLTSLTEAEQEAQAATEAFVQSALANLPSLGDAISNVDKAGEAFGILEASTDPVAVADNLEALIDSFENFTANLAAIGDVAPLVAETLAPLGPEVAGGLAQSLATLPDEFTTNFAAVLQRAEAAGVDLSDLLTEGFGAAGTDGVQTFGDVIDQGAGQVSSSAEAAGQAAAAGVGTGFGVVAAIVQGEMAIASAMVSASGVTLLVPAARAAGTSSGLALGRGFITGTSGSVSVAMSVAQVQIASASVTLAVTARTAGQSIGSALGAGISQGISSQIGGIAKTAAQAVNNAEEAARKAADANSPSRLFAAVGRDMGDGLALGFAEAASGLQAEAERITFAAAVGSSAQAAGGGGRSMNLGGVNVKVEINGDADPRTTRRAVKDGTLDAITLAEAKFDAG